ncbi:hypothetical protein BGW38_010423, partial [Lunasporangiospora selenospora]
IVSIQALKYTAHAAGAGHFEPLDVRLDRLRTAVESNLGTVAGNTIETTAKISKNSAVVETVVEADDGVSIEALRRTVEKLDTDDFEGLEIDHWDFSELEDNPVKESRAEACSKVSNQAVQGPIKDLETVDLEGIDIDDWDDTELEDDPVKELAVESKDEII